MKKHLISAVATLIVLLTIMPSVSATNPGMSSAASRQFRAGFIQDDKAYVYLQMEQNQLANVHLQLKINQSVIQQQRSGYIREGDKPVHNLLLVDCSSTVRAYKEEITQFAYGLLEETILGGGSATISVAGLGNTFRIINESCTDLEALHATLETLNYSDSNTDLYGGIQEALAYIQGQPHSAGELYQLILVTDGRQDKQGQLGLTQEQLGELESSFIQRQDIIFHTYGVSEDWHNQELQQAELGRGCHLSLVETSPEAAAQTIAAFTNSLYLGVFELDVEMIPAPGESLKIQVLYDDQPGGTSVVDIFSLGAAVGGDPENETSAGDETTADEGQNSPEGGQDVPEPKPSDIDEENSDVAIESDDLTNENDTGARWSIGAWLLLPVAVIAALGGWLLCRKVMKSGNRSPKTPPPPGSVCIHIQVERGHCLTRDRNLYLVRELIIGRSHECDLVFDEPEVADRNSRIAIQDGNICIEDLGSPKGTSIGGMRIYAPNRLRSGDVITIGTAVQIRVEYDSN